MEVNVPGVAVQQELLNEVIDDRASHDEQHHTARLLQLGTELLDGVDADDRLPWIGSVTEYELDVKCYTYHWPLSRGSSRTSRQFG
jgi:hypothetical protein